MRKEPQTGGWEYHQDYGYHYAQFLRPEGYASAMLALVSWAIVQHSSEFNCGGAML